MDSEIWAYVNKHWWCWSLHWTVVPPRRGALSAAEKTLQSKVLVAFLFYPEYFCRREKPVRWILLSHVLQRISSSSKPLLSTFGSRIEYVSLVSSSGDMAVPHRGHWNSPLPSILVRSIVYACICFVLVASRAFKSLLCGQSINWFFKILLKSLPNRNCAFIVLRWTLPRFRNIFERSVLDSQVSSAGRLPFPLACIARLLLLWL